MPAAEIRAVLAADDPQVVRRILELHRERLEEWLEEQQRLLNRVERSLAGSTERGLPRSAEGPWPREVSSSASSG